VGLTLMFLGCKLHSTVLEGFCTQEDTWQGVNKNLSSLWHNVGLSATELCLLFSWSFCLLIEENKRGHFKQE